MTRHLAGKKILIVEDEYFIASDLARALEKEGSVAIGPVGGLEQGVALARSEAIDAAILDVNLEGAMSYAIADALRERAIPFMFLTGYDDWALPEEYRDAPRVAKPCPTNAVVSCLRSIFAKEFVS